MANGQANVNVTKVRLGLALVVVVVVAALATMLAIDSPAGKAVMFAIVLTVLVRAYMLFRSLKQEGATPA